jgi:hypothetical protein
MAPNIMLLIAARVVQSIGCGLLLPPTFFTVLIAVGDRNGGVHLGRQPTAGVHRSADSGTSSERHRRTIPGPSSIPTDQDSPTLKDKPSCNTTH